MKTKALIIKDKGVLSFENLETPAVGDYEVLFKTSKCSICTLERRTYLGTRNYGLPFLGGHECSGTIVEIGKGVVEVKPGDRAIFTASFCGQCEDCRSNRGTQCKNKNKMPKRVNFEGNVLGGGLSEYLVLNASHVIKIPSSTNMSYAALTEPLACCIHSIKKANINIGDTVAIIGYGIMGYFHHHLAKMRGARVIVLDVDKKKLLMAKNEGAVIIDSSSDKWKDELFEQFPKGVDRVINTIPVASMWKDAISILAPYGKLLAYSSQNQEKGIEVDFGHMHSKEYELIGTINPTLEDNQVAVNLITSQSIDFSKVIDSLYPFEDAKEAFKKSLEPNLFRVVIDYDGL